MAKTFDGPAVSVTFTQDPDATSPATDPRGEVMASLYCPA
jgi:D-alanyl-D-alanine carboxypeptidase